MPALPSDMKACRARTRRDQAEREARRKAELEHQAKVSEDLDRLGADLAAQLGVEGAALFICRRRGAKA